MIMDRYCGSRMETRMITARTIIRQRKLRKRKWTHDRIYKTTRVDSVMVVVNTIYVIDRYVVLYNERL